MLCREVRSLRGNKFRSRPISVSWLDCIHWRVFMIIRIWSISISCFVNILRRRTKRKKEKDRQIRFFCCPNFTCQTPIENIKCLHLNKILIQKPINCNYIPKHYWCCHYLISNITHAFTFDTASKGALNSYQFYRGSVLCRWLWACTDQGWAFLAISIIDRFQNRLIEYSGGGACAGEGQCRNGDNKNLLRKWMLI